MSVIRRLTNVARGKVKEWQRVWRDGPREEPEVEEPPKKRPPVEEPPPATEDQPPPVREPEPAPKKRRL